MNIVILIIMLIILTVVIKARYTIEKKQHTTSQHCLHTMHDCEECRMSTRCKEKYDKRWII